MTMFLYTEEALLSDAFIEAVIENAPSAYDVSIKDKDTQRARIREALKYISPTAKLERIAGLEAALALRDAMLREALSACETGFPDYCLPRNLQDRIEAELNQ